MLSIVFPCQDSFPILVQKPNDESLGSLPYVAMRPRQLYREEGIAAIYSCVVRLRQLYREEGCSYLQLRNATKTAVSRGGHSSYLQLRSATKTAVPRGGLQLFSVMRQSQLHWVYYACVMRQSQLYRVYYACVRAFGMRLKQLLALWYVKVQFLWWFSRLPLLYRYWLHVSSGLSRC